MSILTRQDCISQLPEGSDQLVIELHLAATAHERHAGRVAAATTAARAYYPTATDRQLGAIMALEASDGVGGPGGYAGGSTDRMAFARGLGKGRRQATDGSAWTAAITTASYELLPGGPGLEDVTSAAELIAGSDLYWPLSYAFRKAYGSHDDREHATLWAELARTIAARCEPDSGAGRLAQRWGLSTLAQLYSAEATLRDETIAAMLGRHLTEHMTLPELTRVEIGDVVIEPLERTRIHVSGDPEWPVNHDDAWRIRISTRVCQAAEPLVRLAWREREGVAEHDEIVRLHAALGNPRQQDLLETVRARWDAEDAGPDVEPPPGWEERAVERAKREGVLS